MVKRDYECEKHGYFTVQQDISASCTATCPYCGFQAKRVILKAPNFAIQGSSPAAVYGEPDYNTDPKGYREWQVERMDTEKARLHPDNVGKSNDSFKRLTKKTGSGKDR